MSPSSFSGTEELRLFQQEAVDLVLLDIMLPWGKMGMSRPGRSFAESEHRLSWWRLWEDKHLIDRYLLAGANDYIVKPLIWTKCLRLDDGAVAKSRLTSKESSKHRKSSPYKSGSWIQKPLNWSLAHRPSLGQKEFQIFETLLVHQRDFYQGGNMVVWEESYHLSDPALNAPSVPIFERKLPSLTDRDYVGNSLGLGCSWKGRQVIWSSSSNSCRPCPSLGTGLPSPSTLCSHRFAGADSKRSSKAGVGYSWPLRPQKEFALTKQVSDLFNQIEADQWLPLKKRRPWI